MLQNRNKVETREILECKLSIRCNSKYVSKISDFFVPQMIPTKQTLEKKKRKKKENGERKKKRTEISLCAN